MKSRTETCTKERLLELASRPDHTVYEYVNDVAEEVLPPEEQLYLYRAILVGFDAGTHAHPTESDEQLRERVLNASPNVRRFQHLYPKVFASSTVRVGNDKEAERLDCVRYALMLMLLEKAKGEGSEEEIAARAMHHSMRLAMRDTTEEDRQHGTVVKEGEGGVPSGMTRLRPADLGHTSVNQLRRRPACVPVAGH